MLYLGAQMELGAHLGHVSMVFEPYKLIGVEIKSIGVSQIGCLALPDDFGIKPGFPDVDT